MQVVKEDENGKQQRFNLKVDFICNLRAKRHYIHSLQDGIVTVIRETSWGLKPSPPNAIVVRIAGNRF